MGVARPAAGLLLGACSVTLAHGGGERLVFSGDLGRDDALTNSFAGSLRRGANQYRALATGRRPSRSATGARAAATAGPASVPFRIAKGRRQTTISVPFSGAALRRLVADAGGRGRTPVRIVVAFHNGRRPIARFADVALRVAAR